MSPSSSTSAAVARRRGGETFDVEDPSTGETLTQVADATPDGREAALDAAVRHAGRVGRHAAQRARRDPRRAFELLTERADDLALLMTLEMGKPLTESKAEIAYAAEFFRWFSGRRCASPAATRSAGNGASRLLTMRQPVGPCLMITPWNFPMAMGTRKIGPAVAAGCTMVVKPAAQTPLTMLALAEILDEAGLPGGVLNVVTTSSTRRRSWSR